jgi:hypothetical protein
MESELRERVRDLLERADNATSVKEIESLREELTRTLVALGEIRGATRARGGGQPIQDPPPQPPVRPPAHPTRGAARARKAA